MKRLLIFAALSCASTFFAYAGPKVPVEIKDKKLSQSVAFWYGTKYRHGGTSRDGVDCSGFVQNAMSASYGISLPRSSADMYKDVKIKRIRKRRLREGDLVFFNIDGSRVSHVGIYLSDGKFVHASSSRGVIVEDLSLDYYKECFKKGGRIKKKYRK